MKAKMIISRHEIDMLTRLLYKEHDDRIAECIKDGMDLSPEMINNATISVDVEVWEGSSNLTLASFHC